MIKLSKAYGGEALPFYRNEYERLGIEYAGKAILNLRLNVYCGIAVPYKVSVTVGTDDGYMPISDKNIAFCRPYPNKNIVSACMMFDRKRSKKFLPLVYDSFEELSKINKLVVHWYFEGFQIITECDISFEKDEKQSVYSYYTYETTNGELPFGKERHNYDKRYICNLSSCYNGCSIEVCEPEAQKCIDAETAISEIDEIIAEAFRFQLEYLCLYADENIPSSVITERIQILYFHSTARLAADEVF